MSKPDDADLPVIPPDHSAENWLNTVRRSEPAPRGNAAAAAEARRLADKLRSTSDSPKAPSRPNQGRQTELAKTPTNSRQTPTSPISSASAEQLALTLLGPSADPQP